MTILNRLKLELNNKEYFSDADLTVFLDENNLTSTAEYDKATNQRNLLYTVIDVLDAVCNDIEVLRKTATEFMTTESAYKHLKERINQIKQKIYDISTEEKDSTISLLYSRTRR